MSDYIKIDGLTISQMVKKLNSFDICLTNKQNFRSIKNLIESEIVFFFNSDHFNKSIMIAKYAFKFSTPLRI